jgi:hypothetical protein
MIYDEYLRREDEYKKEYNKPENVEKRRLELEERKRQEAEMNERLRPRIIQDMMRQSEHGIIFPEK